MKIVVSYPPNIEKIDQVLHVKETPHILYCYGDTIFNPWNEELPEWIVEHEKVHSVRQGDSPNAWWDQYLVDTKFRFEEELVAHQREYQVLCEVSKWLRPKRMEYLSYMAKRLSGKMYGHVCSWREAKDLIRQ